MIIFFIYLPPPDNISKKKIEIGNKMHQTFLKTKIKKIIFFITQKTTKFNLWLPGQPISPKDSCNMVDRS